LEDVTVGEALGEVVGVELGARVGAVASVVNSPYNSIPASTIWAYPLESSPVRKMRKYRKEREGLKPWIAQSPTWPNVWSLTWLRRVVHDSPSTEPSNRQSRRAYPPPNPCRRQ